MHRSVWAMDLDFIDQGIRMNTSQREKRIHSSAMEIMAVTDHVRKNKELYSGIKQQDFRKKVKELLNIDIGTSIVKQIQIHLNLPKCQTRGIQKAGSAQNSRRQLVKEIRRLFRLVGVDEAELDVLTRIVGGKKLEITDTE